MLLCVYFPPDSPDYVFLEFISTVQRLVHHHPEYDIIIAGDFNLPDVDWYTIDALSLVSSQFCDFIFTYNLTYVMNNTNAKGNILDLVILNCPERFVDISIDNKSIGCGLSDHYFIVVELLIVNEAVSRLNQNNASYCFCFKKFDFKEVDSYFLDQDFSTLLNSNNVELLGHFSKVSYLMPVILLYPRNISNHLVTLFGFLLILDTLSIVLKLFNVASRRNHLLLLFRNLKTRKKSFQK